MHHCCLAADLRLGPIPDSFSWQKAVINFPSAGSPCLSFVGLLRALWSFVTVGMLALERVSRRYLDTGIVVVLLLISVGADTRLIFLPEGCHQLSECRNLPV